MRRITEELTCTRHNAHRTQHNAHHTTNTTQQHAPRKHARAKGSTQRVRLDPTPKSACRHKMARSKQHLKTTLCIGCIQRQLTLSARHHKEKPTRDHKQMTTARSPNYHCPQGVPIGKPGRTGTQQQTQTKSTSSEELPRRTYKVIRGVRHLHSL